jgi:Domain of unknown function (DUF4279)
MGADFSGAEGQMRPHKFQLLSEVRENVYDDEYATCEETYATLCLYRDDLNPETVTRELGLQPTDTQTCNKARTSGTETEVLATGNGWFLESRDFVQSRDLRRHVDWVLDQVEPQAKALKRLKEGNYKAVISCFWVSAHWHGGPMLCPAQVSRLAALGLEVWFDFYFSCGDNDTDGDDGDDGTGLAPPPPIADRDLEPEWEGVGQRSRVPVASG